MEERIKLGVKSYYQFLQTNQKRFMRNRFRDSLLYLGLALLSLFLSFYFNRTLNTSYLSKILIEGFNIGGWVFFWEFLALSVFKSRSQRKELARAKRIELGKLTFFYSPSLQ